MFAYNAVIVAGGQSSRLGGTPKAGLSNGTQTLLESTLAAAFDAQVRVVVGPEDLPLPVGVLQTLEEPRFSGPAAALAAGVKALPQESAAWTLVLSVDMPGAREAVQALVQYAEKSSECRGFMGIADGIIQPLAGIYRTEDLRTISDQDVANRSVRRWLGQIPYEMAELPSGSTQDVDTWEQAQASGFTEPTW